MGGGAFGAEKGEAPASGLEKGEAAAELPGEGRSGSGAAWRREKRQRSCLEKGEAPASGLEKGEARYWIRCGGDGCLFFFQRTE